MRKALFLLPLSFWISPRLCAQAAHHLDIPRYEAGFQFDVTELNGVGEWGGGFGGRFDCNFTEHLALDAQVTYRQHNVASFSGPIISGVVGQTTGLFGVRAGQRVEDFGFFAQARAGFLHFGTDQGLTLLTKATFPAFNVGGTLEHYRGPVILRFDLGEMIVAYGSAGVSPGPPTFPLPPPPARLGTRASPMVGLGFAIRF